MVSMSSDVFPLLRMSKVLNLRLGQSVTESLYLRQRTGYWGTGKHESPELSSHQFSLEL